MQYRIIVLSMLGAGLLAFTACEKKIETSAEPYRQEIRKALTAIGMGEDSLSVPKLGGMQISTQGRLAMVDSAMNDPLSMITLSRRIRQTSLTDSPVAYLSQLLSHYGLTIQSSFLEEQEPPHARELWEQLRRLAPKDGKYANVPKEWSQLDDPAAPMSRALKRLLYAEVKAEEAYRKAGVSPSPEEWLEIRSHLAGVIRGVEPIPADKRWLIPKAYHQMGARVDLSAMASALVGLQTAVEHAMPDLQQAAKATSSISFPIMWDTPLGKIRVTGTGPDHHQGRYLLLVDLGGDDVYENAGSTVKDLEKSQGHVSIVLDLSGDDKTIWTETTGPGAGVFGLSIWVDMAGDDRYIGGNLGLGAGLFGAGMLWDANGNDSYESGSLAQGAGQYGLGLLVDSAGTDKYKTAIAGQGFGGPGGIGIVIDREGDDHYSCGEVVPDEVEERTLRHDAVHYLSMCQGFGFGLRPESSGGIGALIDMSGNDNYQADIFAQGSAYWFGLGMLIDYIGDDRYSCFEHCQGESVHLGAGILADLGGNDHYKAYEHAQGTGVDRAAGILYDASGDDYYQVHQDSQGAGLKPFGAGILIDASGNDHYESTMSSQGFAATAQGSEGFPDGQWPVGILLDLEGEDSFKQPYIDAPSASARKRIQNQHGIAVDQ